MELSKEEENSFITAKSLISDFPVVYHDMTKNEAAEIFKSTQYQTLPVVHKITRKLIGTINQKDLVQKLIEKTSNKTID